MRRPQNFEKSSPYFWLQYIQSKVKWRFRNILWPSQNIWTLIKQTFAFIKFWIFICFFEKRRLFGHRQEVVSNGHRITSQYLVSVDNENKLLCVEFQYKSDLVWMGWVILEFHTKRLYSLPQEAWYWLSHDHLRPHASIYNIW